MHMFNVTNDKSYISDFAYFQRLPGDLSLPRLPGHDGAGNPAVDLGVVRAHRVSRLKENERLCRCRIRSAAVNPSIEHPKVLFIS